MGQKNCEKDAGDPLEELLHFASVNIGQDGLLLEYIDGYRRIV